MSELPALRVVAGEAQAAFPWLDDDPHKVLGIPPEDVERYRIRRDIKDCRWVGLDRRMTGDPRYHAFLELADRSPYPTGLLALGLFLMAGELARRPEGPMGLAEPGQNVARMTLKAWCLPADHEEAFDAAIRIGLDRRVGLFRIVDTLKVEDTSAYACVRARRAGAAARRRQTDEQTDEKPSTAAPDESPGRATGDDDGAAESPPDDQQAYRVLRALEAELTTKRKRMGKSAYPLTGQDRQDLMRAVLNACVRGEVDALTAVLHQTCHWADSGRGFRKALRDGGFL